MHRLFLALSAVVACSVQSLARCQTTALDIAKASEAKLATFPHLDNGRKAVIIASDRGCLKEAVQAMNTEGLAPRQKLEELQKFGCFFTVENGTHVRFRTTSEPETFVSIFGGGYYEEGKTGWVMTSWIHGKMPIAPEIVKGGLNDPAMENVRRLWKLSVTEDDGRDRISKAPEKDKEIIRMVMAAKFGDADDLDQEAKEDGFHAHWFVCGNYGSLCASVPIAESTRYAAKVFSPKFGLFPDVPLGVQGSRQGWFAFIIKGEADDPSQERWYARCPSLRGWVAATPAREAEYAAAARKLKNAP